MKHMNARMAALALGTCLTMAACGDNRDGRETTDTAGGTVAAAPVTEGAGTGSMEATDANAPRTDSDIMTMISHSNSAEVSSSELAMRNASNAQVKAFARQMVTEHTKMQKEGQALGKQLGQEGTGTQASADKKDMAMDKLDDLKDKKGADFDKAYMEFQVQAHQQTLSELQQYQNTAQNAELKAMIQKAIPAVQQHLQKAQQIQQQLGS